MTDTPATDTATAKPRAVISVRVFLRGRPGPCVAGPSLDAARGFFIAGKDTTGALNGDFRGQWLGNAALQFVKEHEAELVPGRCVDLQITNVRPKDSEFRADILSCEMAPLAPSWIAHQEKQTQATTTEKAPA